MTSAETGGEPGGPELDLRIVFPIVLGLITWAFYVWNGGWY